VRFGKLISRHADIYGARLLRGSLIPLLLAVSVVTCAETYEVEIESHLKRPFVPNDEVIRQLADQLYGTLTDSERVDKVRMLKRSYAESGTKRTLKYRLSIEGNALMSSTLQSQGKVLPDERVMIRDGLAFVRVAQKGQTGIVYDLREYPEIVRGLVVPYLAVMIANSRTSIPKFLTNAQSDGVRTEVRIVSSNGRLQGQLVSDASGSPKVGTTFDLIEADASRATIRIEPQGLHKGGNLKFRIARIRRLNGNSAPLEIPFEKGKWVADRRAVPDGGPVRRYLWTGELPPAPSRPMIPPGNVVTILAGASVAVGIGVLAWRRRRSA
ncbi:MAG: hypothetical protein SFX74_11755, partial [Fimbriimonadaceae bacterium]|nr:hypothetical protein [Fimbriimonadaceae bacterium]